MDNQNPNFSLDPDQINTQGPVISRPTTQTPSKVIDISPEKNPSLPLTPSVSPVDEALLPDHKVIDITPPFDPPADPAPSTTPSTTAPVETPISTPTATTPTTPTSSPVTTPVAPITPPTTATPPGFQIDSSSPLFEDPDKIVLPR